MIICGFPGIGKSTLAKSDRKYIDFESTNFDKSNPNWYKDYCNCVLDLNKQGYTVFCSSHDTVTKYLSNKAKISIVFPSIEIKDDWINRVRERYEKDKSEKNKKALAFVESYLEDGINNIYNNFENKDNIILIPIKNINYNLQDYIDGPYNKRPNIDDFVTIIEMKNEPSYSGKQGFVKSIDSAGQIHGTWGGCALIPSVDEFKILKY